MRDKAVHNLSNLSNMHVNSSASLVMLIIHLTQQVSLNTIGSLSMWLQRLREDSDDLPVSKHISHVRRIELHLFRCLKMMNTGHVRRNYYCQH